MSKKFILYSELPYEPNKNSWTCCTIVIEFQKELMHKVYNPYYLELCEHINI